MEYPGYGLLQGIEPAEEALFVKKCLGVRIEGFAFQGLRFGGLRVEGLGLGRFRVERLGFRGFRFVPCSPKAPRIVG